VLPGVTVEAASPVLIEKVRAATTDGTGRYTIPDLRPGVYTVTFTLPGFRTIVREGVVLSGTSTTDINAELAVGAVQETITVSGETPVVNLQSTTRQSVMDQEIVSAIPSSRTPFTVGVLIPGVRRGAFMSQDVGGSVVQEVASLEFNNSRTSDQRMMVNGVALSSMIAGGWGGGAVPNATGTAEFAIDVSGVDAQAATGGVRINFIPRTGGNRFSGTIFGSFSHNNFASDNYTGTDVEERGLSSPATVKANGDFNPGFGGPIVQDRLWFFFSGRYLFAENYVPGMFYNANVNDVNNFRWVSSGEQAYVHQDQQIYQGNLTWQASPRNKFGMTFDQENFCACATGVSATTSPEAGSDRRFPLQRFVTVDWSSPLSNRLLLEASGIHRVERWGGMHLQTGKGGNPDELVQGLTSVTDNPSLATGASLTYRSAAQYNNSWNWNLHYRAAMSFITGSHAFKVGFNNAYGHHENTTYADPVTPYAFNFNRGNTVSIAYRIVPRTVHVNVDQDLGLFAQDKWTVGRWTLAGGIRFDSFKNSFPPQSIAPTSLAPNLSVSFPEQDNLSWQDITPKMGATYDLFGTGRTALKVTLNKYLEGLGTTGFGAAQVTDAPNPINRLNLGGAGTTRSWGDTDGDFFPDCVLQDYQANGECGTLIGAATFGTVVPSTTYDPDLLTGWGRRQYNWEFTAGVQHEIVPRVSIDLQYGRRWYGNRRVTDDLSVTAQSYDRFTFTTPTDSRLPDGGGVTLTGYDLKPTPTTTPNYFVTLADNFGAWTENYDGVNTTVNARLQNGLTVQGGFNTGRVVTDDCSLVEALPEMLHTFVGNPTRTSVFAARPLERCEENNGWRTSVQGFASYRIPRIDVQVSGTFQNLPGLGVNANANISAANTSLGRPFTGAPGGRFFNIIEAGDLFVERLNQIDLRATKIFQVGGTRTSINFDFYNVLNANSVITENSTYSPPPSTAWRTPQSILLPRLFKISAQFDF
jgi:hypothetical protein